MILVSQEPFFFGCCVRWRLVLSCLGGLVAAATRLFLSCPCLVLCLALSYLFDQKEEQEPMESGVGCLRNLSIVSFPPGALDVGTYS